MISAHLLPPSPLLPLLHRSLLVLLHHLPSLTSNNRIQSFSLKFSPWRWGSSWRPDSASASPPDPLSQEWTSLQNPSTPRLLSACKNNTIFWQNLQMQHFFLTHYSRTSRASCHQCQPSSHLLMPATPRRAISPKTEPSPSVLFFVF